MSSEFSIQQAIAGDAQEVAVMVGELLSEIMNAIGVQAFNFDLAETSSRLKDFIEREKYFVFVARSGSGSPAGFIALYESYALYAEGAFGTIPELYIRPEYRTNGWGFSSFLKRSLLVHRGAGHAWRLRLHRFRSSTELCRSMSVRGLQ
jgi:GNAT superfamily N-acetyltransferase